VAGFAVTGQAVAKWLVENGALVRIFDSRPADEFIGALSALPRAVEASFQAGPSAALRGVDLVVTSPGVPAGSEILCEARRRQIPVWSEIELAYRVLEAPVIAVTGTNGKSTTVSLIGEMANRGGIRTFVGGNLGRPLIEATQACFEIAVAEVSSFQLEWVETFRPRVSVLLNVTADHLDRHGDLDSYGRTKLRIMENQRNADAAFYNRDDDWLRRNVVARFEGVASFGFARVPKGAFLEGNTIELVTSGGGERYSLERLRLPGAHNWANAMAAVLAARAVGVPPEAVQAALDSFTGLAHRLEFVRERAGVRYIDDSKATNVDAVVRALASCTGPVILLAGGRGKGGSFDQLKEPAKRHVKVAFLFGESAESIARAIAPVVPVKVVADLPSAVAEAARVAMRGDTVLLSPACASFDRYRDYKERGEEFKRVVAQL